ncbi:MAG: sulfatase-like hydrolase/transferase [Candidatus Aminicenantes bacterium]|nr:sulfatase-like hydrolase/transferase [Candidatus Aminicenantes bacterium]
MKRSGIVSPIKNSIIASLIAAASMAVSNVFVEIIKQDSILQFKDIFRLSLWHMFVWLWFGAAAGLIFALYFALKKKKSHPQFLTYLIYLYILIALFAAFVGYINQDLLSSVFSPKSMAVNSAFIAAGAALFILFFKKIKITQIQTFPTALRIYVLVLLLILCASVILNLGLVSKSSSPLSQVMDRPPNNFNVVMISLDAVRADHLSCYGYSRKTTPHIDQLASKGILFSNAFSHASHTKESVPSLLTSTYPSTHNVKTLTSALPKNLITLPSVFKAFGYQTALFSANGVVSPAYGYTRGVDDFFGSETDIIRATILGNLLHRVKTLDLPVLSPTINRIIEWSTFLIRKKSSIQSDDAGHVTQKALTWITEHQNKPFFMYVHYAGSHAPYLPPAPYHKMFVADEAQKPVINFPPNLEMFWPFVKGKALPEPKRKNMIAQYDGELFDHDQNLGLLFDHLKKLRLEEKTILIITADHGEEFYDHQGWGHGHSLFDEVIHVPLIISSPVLIPQAKTVNDLVAQVDVFPTLCRVCGISQYLKLPYEIEGMDFSPLFTSSSQRFSREFVFSEVFHAGNSAKSLRTEKFKAIKVVGRDQTQHFVFDLIADPDESTNVIQKHPSAAKELFERIDFLVKRAQKKSFDSLDITLDEDLKDKLRTLGYIK